MNDEDFHKQFFNINSPLGCLNMFKKPKIYANKMCYSRPPFPPLVSNPRLREIYDNFAISDSGFLFGFMILTFNQMSTFLRQKDPFTGRGRYALRAIKHIDSHKLQTYGSMFGVNVAIVRIMCLMGVASSMLMCSTHCYYRLTGEVYNGQRWATPLHTIKKYDMTSRSEIEGYTSIFRYNQ